MHGDQARIGGAVVAVALTATLLSVGVSCIQEHSVSPPKERVSLTSVSSKSKRAEPRITAKDVARTHQAKAPVPRAGEVRAVLPAEGGYRVVLDLAPSKLCIDLWGRHMNPLAHSVTQLPRHYWKGAALKFLSAAVFMAKARAIDEGVIASVLAHVEVELGQRLGRRAMLARLYGSLSGISSREADAASVRLAVALDRVGIRPGVPGRLRSQVAALSRSAKRDPWLDVPYGLFTWSPSLEGVFRSMRLLAVPMPRPVAAAVANSINADPALAEAYLAHQALWAEAVDPSGERVIARAIVSARDGRPSDVVGEAAIMPSRRAGLTRRISRALRSPPANMEYEHSAVALAELVRTGRFVMRSAADAGALGSRESALEALLVPDLQPEGAKIVLWKNDNHCKNLAYMVSSVVYLGGHMGEGWVVPLCCPPREPGYIHVGPRLSLDPLPTFYRRVAQSYRKLEAVLVRHLGRSKLRQLKRLAPPGMTPPSSSLAMELRFAADLFDGAALASERELGLVSPKQRSDRDQIEQRRRMMVFRKWQSQLATDPDMAQDVRGLTPISRGNKRGTVNVIANLGFRERTVQFKFCNAGPVLLEVLDPMGRPMSKGSCRVFLYYGPKLPYPSVVSTSFSARKLLSPRDFRRLAERPSSAYGVAYDVEQALK